MSVTNYGVQIETLSTQASFHLAITLLFKCSCYDFWKRAIELDSLVAVVVFKGQLLNLSLILVNDVERVPHILFYIYRVKNFKNCETHSKCLRSGCHRPNARGSHCTMHPNFCWGSKRHCVGMPNDISQDHGGLVSRAGGGRVDGLFFFIERCLPLCPSKELPR